jgi:hypothetical protein
MACSQTIPPREHVPATADVTVPVVKLVVRDVLLSTTLWLRQPQSTLPLLLRIPWALVLQRELSELQERSPCTAVPHGRWARYTTMRYRLPQDRRRKAVICDILLMHRWSIDPPEHRHHRLVR